MTYSDELLELRKKFEAVDKKDPESIRRWFDKYPYLSTNDHAQIANYSNNYIYKLRRIAGIKGRIPKNLPKTVPAIQVKAIILEVPDDWDNKEWLNKIVGIYSVTSIAIACGVSRYVIYNRLKRYEITKRKSRKSNNKCCTKDWCLKHYVELGWSQRKCAKKAGICQQTFPHWLNRFKIPVRNKREASKSHKNVRLWVRELVNNLEKQPTVRKVFLRSNHIHIRLMNYFWETYYVDDPNPKATSRPPFSYIITKQDAKISKVPQVLPEYEASLGEEIYDNGIIQTPHIMINRKELNKVSLVERRLAVHEYCRQLTQRDWMWPEYPDHVLREEWDKLCDFKPEKYIQNDMFTIFSSKHIALGRKITEHFFDISECGAVFKSPRLTLRVLNELLRRRDLPFNFHNALRIFSTCPRNITMPPRYQKYRVSDPAAYAVLFQRLGIKGSILDLSPGFGNRAIAAALEGLKYYTIPDERFQKALDKEFVEFTGLDYEKWDNHKVDVLLYDNNFGVPDMKKVMGYLKYAKKMVVFVPYKKKLSYQAKYKPKSVVKLKTRWFQKTPDWIFIW